MKERNLIKLGLIASGVATCFAFNLCVYYLYCTAYTKAVINMLLGIVNFVLFIFWASYGD
jgi:hypothetical protein